MYLHFVILFVLSQAADAIDMFNIDADDIFESEIGELVKRRNDMDPVKLFPEPFVKFMMSKNSFANNNRTFRKNVTKGTKKKLYKINKFKNVTTTTDRNDIATHMPDMLKFVNLSIDDMMIRKRTIKMARILNTRYNPIPRFNKNEGDTRIITRRFDELVREVNKPSLRQYYFYFDNQTLIYREKMKIISLMQHYVYETRYKLPYSQIMRLTFKDNIRYKIGYCFALLRQLRYQAKIINSMQWFQYKKVKSMMFVLKMHEKMMRLEVDIRDLIEFIKKLDTMRLKEEHSSEEVFTKSPLNQGRRRVGEWIAGE